MNERRSIIQVDLDNNIEASKARVEELRKGRERQDIPMHDEYWLAVTKYHQTFDRLKEKH